MHFTCRLRLRKSVKKSGWPHLIEAWLNTKGVHVIQWTQSSQNSLKYSPSPGALGNSFDTYYPPAVSITKDMALSSQVSCGPAQSSQRTSSPEWPSYTSNSTRGQVPRARPAQPCLEACSRLCRSLVETCGAPSTLDVQGWRVRKTRYGKPPFRKALYLQCRLLHWNCVAPAVPQPMHQELSALAAGQNHGEFLKHRLSRSPWPQTNRIRTPSTVVLKVCSWSRN